MLNSTRAALIAVLGAVLAGVLGLLTFGVQATVHPDRVPLAVVAPAPIAERITGQGGTAVDWRVTDSAGAQDMLARKEVYGYLTVTAGPAGPVVGGVTSGAVNPSATQVAEQVLRGAGAAVVAATHASTPFTLTTVHPTAPAAKVLPLAATTLLWIGALAANALLLLAFRRSDRTPTRAARLTLVVVAAVAGPALVYLLGRWWAPEVTWQWPALGYLALVGFAFAAAQAAVLRLAGVAGLPLLGLLYLMAPSIAGQPPELLNPVYRALLWSWSPFRFVTDPLRSLLFLHDRTADVTTGLVVFGALAAAGVLVLLLPKRTPRPQPEAVVAAVA